MILVSGEDLSLFYSIITIFQISLLDQTLVVLKGYKEMLMRQKYTQLTSSGSIVF